jgi:hypothetical protein
MIPTNTDEVKEDNIKDYHSHKFDERKSENEAESDKEEKKSEQIQPGERLSAESEKVIRSHDQDEDYGEDHDEEEEIQEEN